MRDCEVTATVTHVCLFIHLSVCLSVCLSVFLSFFISFLFSFFLYLYNHLYNHLSFKVNEFHIFIISIICLFTHLLTHLDSYCVCQSFFANLAIYSTFFSVQKYRTAPSYFLVDKLSIYIFSLVNLSLWICILWFLLHSIESLKEEMLWRWCRRFFVSDVVVRGFLFQQGAVCQVFC